MLIRATIDTLAKALRVRPDQAEDVVRSEHSARAAFDRRGLFQAAGAVAAGVAFGDVVLPRADPEIVVALRGLCERIKRLSPLSPDDYIFRAGDFEANGYEPVPLWNASPRHHSGGSSCAVPGHRSLRRRRAQRRD